MINAEAKLKSVQRELIFRRKVYPKLVAKRQMRQAQADYEIHVFEAIERDYIEQTIPPHPDLLTRQP